MSPISNEIKLNASDSFAAGHTRYSPYYRRTIQTMTITTAYLNKEYPSPRVFENVDLTS